MKNPKSPINAQILIDQKGMMKTFPAMARVSRAIHYIKQKTQHYCQVLKLAPPVGQLSNQVIADLIVISELPGL